MHPARGAPIGTSKMATSSFSPTLQSAPRRLDRLRRSRRQSGAMNMTRTVTARDDGPGRTARRTTWRVRAFVLGGLALAAVYTAVALGLDAGAERIGRLWMAAIVWTVAASLASVLWRGFRRRDWSAFSSYELPEDDGDMDEFISRTGRYSSLGEMEDRMLHDHDHLR